ncbi:MAG: hypothetical protein QM571_04230 [Micrococcaceae bacterium]
MSNTKAIDMIESSVKSAGLIEVTMETQPKSTVHTCHIYGKTVEDANPNAVRQRIAAQLSQYRYLLVDDNTPVTFYIVINGVTSEYTVSDNVPV